MLQFRQATAGAGLSNWEVVDGHVLSFGRDDLGHILINTHDEAVEVTVSSSLPAGRYTDLLSGRQVDASDDAQIMISLEPRSVVAVLADSE